MCIRDSSQAEAVIDMIRAKTDKTFDVALEQLDGQLSQKVIQIRQAILDLLVNLTVNIDYPDEDIEELTYEDLEINISQINDMIEKLLATADTGRIIRAVSYTHLDVYKRQGCMFLDKLPSRRNFVSHQRREYIIGGCHVIQCDLDLSLIHILFQYRSLEAIGCMRRLAL